MRGIGTAHGAKAARNLGLFALAGLFLWGLLDFPAPTLESGFRMVERTNWAGPSTLQGVFEGSYDRWIVATCQDQVIFWREGEPSLEYWPRAAEGPTLVPAPESRMAQGEVWVAAVDVPEGAASARLELTVGCWYRKNGSSGWTFDSKAEQPGDAPPLTQRWERSYHLQGQPLEDGAFLFHAAGEEEQWESGSPEGLILSYAYQWDLYWRERGSRAIDCTMEAVFYDAEGRELDRAVLATTELGGGPWTGS